MLPGARKLWRQISLCIKRNFATDDIVEVSNQNSVMDVAGHWDDISDMLLLMRLSFHWGGLSFVFAIDFPADPPKGLLEYQWRSCRPEQTNVVSSGGHKRWQGWRAWRGRAGEEEGHLR